IQHYLMSRMHTCVICRLSLPDALPICASAGEGRGRRRAIATFVVQHRAPVPGSTRQRMRGLVGQPRERCVTRHAPLLGLERCTVPQQPATEEADLESTASCRRLPLSRTLVGMADTARLRQWLATLTTEQLQMVLEAIPTFTAGTQIRD